MKSVDILGVRVDDVTMAQAVDLVEGYVRAPIARCRQVASVNPEFIMTARRRPDFARALAESDLNIPDGANLVRAAQLLGRPLRERVAGSDLTPLTMERAAGQGWKVFLLGAGPGVAERAAARLCAQHPALEIAGVFAGSPDPTEEKGLRERVNDSGAQLLFIAYGAPAQDLWIARNREQLKARVAFGIGGTLDFIAGEVPRAPRWMQESGLEWLFRLAREPRRLRRQSVLVGFIWLVLKERLRQSAGRDR